VNGGMMLAILGYMFVVEPILAAACLAFFVPQAIAVPAIQRVMNRFIERRIGLLRDFGEQVAHAGEERAAEPGSDHDHGAKLDAIYRNRIRIYLLKYANKVLVDRLADPLRELVTFYTLAAQSRVRHDAIARWM
jgi:hypothetical protein